VHAPAERWKLLFVLEVIIRGCGARFTLSFSHFTCLGLGFSGGGLEEIKSSFWSVYFRGWTLPIFAVLGGVLVVGGVCGCVSGRHLFGSTVSPMDAVPKFFFCVRVLFTLSRITPRYPPSGSLGRS